MSVPTMRSFKGLFTGALAACLSVVLVGCADSGKKVDDGSNKDASKTAVKPADKTKTAKVRPFERVSKTPADDKQPAAKSVKVERPAAEKPPVRASAVKRTPPPVVKTAQQPSPAPAPEGGDQGELRRDTTDAIYAAIRVRMEQAILKRKELLDAGRAPSDVEIRGLEGQITKARGYLIEAGEEVEDVDPPLLTKPKS